MVLETLIFTPFNHLTRLVAQEDFIMYNGCCAALHNKKWEAI
jgi:hypothetical protein